MSIRDISRDGRMTVLLTGGRAPVTLELARSFHAAGHRVLVAESARYHLCRVSRAVERCFRVPSPNSETLSFLEAIESIAISERVDAIIPTCEEIFYIAKGLDRLSRHCAVWAAPIGQLKELHDKWRFVLLAKRHGLTVPETKLIATREDWTALAEEERIGESLVLKPVYSRFASRVFYMAKEDTQAKRRNMLAEAISAVSPETPWVAQRRIDGRHICTYSVAFEGELIAHAAYPSRYRVGDGATVHFEPVRHDPALEWVRRLVRAIRFTGQIAFDFIEEEGGGLYAIECNPRATSGVHLFGAELVQAFLRPKELRESGGMLTPDPSGSAMLTAAMLGAGLGSIRSFGGLSGWYRDFRSARDVVFSRSDLRPSIEQLRVLASAWRTSRARGIKLVQATTIDLEWNGET